MASTSVPRRRGTGVPPRFQQGPITTALNLGPLASLAGTWYGSGFNAIWRPDNSQAEPGVPQDKVIRRFLELNLTSEVTIFQVIPGVVPNRGLEPQSDLSLYGLHYLQRISDADKPPFSTAGEAIHIEPGLFMNVPAFTSPNYTNGANAASANAASIVRMASIPHGVTVMMQGPTPSTTPTAGAPVIPPIFPLQEFPVFVPAPPIAPLPGLATDGNGIQPVNLPVQQPPVEHQIPEVTLSNDNTAFTEQANGPYPPTAIPPILQAYVDDPNVVLRNAIADQDILGFIQIDLNSTAAANDIANIPFLGNPGNAYTATPTANAFVESARATFWIEWVLNTGYPDYPFESNEHQQTMSVIEPYWPKSTHLQLQYSQVVVLVFNKVRWPHVSVATLTLSAG